MSHASGIYAGDWTPALARLFGEKTALVEHPSGRAVSYRELATRVSKAAAALASLGVGRGDRVAVLAKNRLEQIDLLFACARLGALFVPLNWRLKEPELVFLLDDAEPKVVFFGRAFECVMGRAELPQPGLRRRRPQEGQRRAAEPHHRDESCRRERAGPRGAGARQALPRGPRGLPRLLAKARRHGAGLH